jgi:2-methylisocitrate lyase-like PEP mutase family enzyme
MVGSAIMHDSTSPQSNHRLKHVAMWRLREQAEEASKRVNAARAKVRLEGLKQQIPEIVDLEVGLNLDRSAGDYDLVLTVSFGSDEALRDFLENPAYQEVTAFMDRISDDCHAVGYDRRVHPSDRLRALIQAKPTLVMPDAYDALSAQLIERAGFSAVQCSGYSMALAAGLADECRLTRDYNLQLTRQIVQAVSVPVMADGEDGYEDVGETVWKFMEAGIAGINLEDQILGGDSVVRVQDRQLMIGKLQHARKAADRFSSARLVINARTDVLRAGPDRERQLEKAAQRANAYLDAGADLVFVPYVETYREAAILKKAVAGPLSVAAGLSYNMEHFSVAQLCELGVARVSLPTFVICAAMHRMKQALAALRRTGQFDRME